MITAILSAIANASSLLDHLWQTFNGSGAVQAKVAQMDQAGKDAHNKLVNDAMHGTPEQKAAALAELKKLVSE